MKNRGTMGPSRSFAKNIIEIYQLTYLEYMVATAVIFCCQLSVRNYRCLFELVAFIRSRASGESAPSNKMARTPAQPHLPE